MVHGDGQVRNFRRSRFPPRGQVGREPRRTSTQIRELRRRNVFVRFGDSGMAGRGAIRRTGELFVAKSGSRGRVRTPAGSSVPVRHPPKPKNAPCVKSCSL
jgi:hypothetical protein